MFKMSTIGRNTSMKACWPLVNCVINQATASNLATHAAGAVAAHQCHESDSDVIFTSQVK